MKTGTYGLSTSVRGPAGSGPGLGSLAVNEGAQATQMLGQAAADEQSRMLANQQREQEAQAGGRQLGASAGAMAGFAYGGPWGAVIGGTLGALFGDDLF